MAQLRYYIEDYRRGSFSAGAVNDTVREVGGSDPEDFETIVRRRADSDPMSKPSLANKLRVVAGFIKIVLTAAPDLSAYEAAQHQPLLRAPEYGINNAAWRETHDVTVPLARRANTRGGTPVARHGKPTSSTLRPEQNTAVAVHSFRSRVAYIQLLYNQKGMNDEQQRQQAQDSCDWRGWQDRLKGRRADARARIFRARARPS